MDAMRVLSIEATFWRRDVRRFGPKSCAVAAKDNSMPIQRD